jgi:hypothetical protein
MANFGARSDDRSSVSSSWRVFGRGKTRRVESRSAVGMLSNAGAFCPVAARKAPAAERDYLLRSRAGRSPSTSLEEVGERSETGGGTSISQSRARRPGSARQGEVVAAAKLRVSRAFRLRDFKDRAFDDRERPWPGPSEISKHRGGKFQSIAEETKRSCPVSKALAGTSISLKATPQ